MAITVTQLITQAFYVSGIVSRDFETVTGDQLIHGQQILDDLLAEKLIDDKAIPYYTNQSLTMVVGQEQYDVANLIDVDSMTYVIDTVRYPMWQEASRTDYFGEARANNVESLPYKYRVERTLNGSSIYLYFKPDVAYVAEIWGKFGLAVTTSIVQNLLLTYDRYYLTFLKYELAERLCTEYEYSVPVGLDRTLIRLRKQISKKSAVLDLELQITSTLGGQSSLSYGQVNLGNAWTR